MTGTDAAATVLISGGGSGIGAATAAFLATRGWQVICGGLDRDADLPPGIAFHRLDVTSADSVAAFLAQAPDRIGGLVHCAGMIGRGAEWDDDGFARVLDVNLSSVLRLSQAALPRLLAGQGSVVTLASMWSLFGAANAPAYAASKTGLVGLTRSLALAWGPQGVRVNAVAPGWIRTRLAAPAMDDPARGPKALARIPLGRWGQPEDVARVIGFLLSGDAAYVNGCVLPVDGGYAVA